ncbi:MAG: hypothetical protein IPJ98_16355 [Bryobacterales bacterium]|nr:hypothetical protein [Bryobacterales bacterium]
MPGRYLGGRLADAPKFIGIARMPVGVDGTVRGWYMSLDVNGYETPSLTGKTVEIYCAGKKPGCHATREPSFGRDYRFAAMNLREFVTAPPPLSISSCAVGTNETDPRLEGKIVVVGGFYPGSDRHDSPWGTKHGAELVAMSIEETLNPQGLGHLPTICKWVLKLLLALAVAVLHHFLWPVAATIATVLLLPVAVFMSSLAIFWFGEYQTATVPLIVGVLLEQLVTSAEKGEHWARSVPGQERL